MVRRIVIQPNGKYSVYSTIIDDLILFDATKEEYINFMQGEVKTELEDKFKEIEQGNGKRYNCLSWNGALEEIQLHHGKKHLDDLLRELNPTMQEW